MKCTPQKISKKFGGRAHCFRFLEGVQGAEKYKMRFCNGCLNKLAA